MIARPKMSQNERKPTEIRASKVGQRPTLFLPRLELGSLGAHLARLTGSGTKAIRDATARAAASLSYAANCGFDDRCSEYAAVRAGKG